MEIKVVKPINNLLKKHISNYYIFQHEENEEVNYLAFPQPSAVVSVFKNIKVEYLPNTMILKFSDGEPIVSDLILSHEVPILIKCRGKIQEISIVFKPLGLNAFLQQSKEPIIEKVPFFPYIDYKEKMSAILDIPNMDEKIRQLEEYLLSKFVDFKHPFLYQFINDVETNSITSIGKASQKYGVSQKTLIKHSKAYLNRTPSEYIKNVRFHKAIATYLKDEQRALTLTEIGYAVSFFDQAHMIKDFKSFTGYAPSHVFKNLKSIEGELNWIFL